MKYAILLAMLLLMVGTVVAQDSAWNSGLNPIFDPAAPTTTTVPDKCATASMVRTVNGTVLAGCFDGNWFANQWELDRWRAKMKAVDSCPSGTDPGQDYHEGLKVDGECENCQSWPYTKPPEPADVPAVQEKRLIRLKGETYTDAQDIWTAQKDMYESFWSCADKKRVLLTSVDGSIHVCHKVNQ